MPFLSSVIRHLSSDRDRLILWLPVLLGVGIGGYFALPVEPPLAWPAIASGTLLLALFWRWTNVAARMAVLAALVMSIGFLAASIRTHMVATPVIYGELFFREVEGRIEDVQKKEKGTKLILSQLSMERLPPERVPVRISVTLKKPPEDMQVGDRIAMKAMLFESPGPSKPGAFDFARMFYFQRLGAVGFAPSEATIIAREGTSGFEQWLTDLRLRLMQKIMAPMSDENGPIASAMMVGETSQVSEEVSDVLRASGLYHILSISGLHMTLAAGLVYFAARLLLSLYPRWALRLPTKKIAAIIGLVGALTYLMLAGYPVPAVRSFIMVACVMLAILFDRQGISLYSLAWAASFILLLWPEAMLGVSFQLSFAATVAIVALYERYGAALNAPQGHWFSKLWRYFFALMITSLVVTLATTPFVIYHFSRFTLWGVVANMLMMPLASFWIMPAAVIAFLALPFGLEHFPLVALDYGLRLMMDGSRWIASMPQSSLTLPPPTFLGILLVAIGGLWLCIWRGRVALLGLVPAVLGICSMALYRPYDLLISDDAKKIAVRLESGDHIFLRGKPTSFDGEQWMRVDGEDKGLTRRQGKERLGDLACDKDVCRMEFKGKHIAAAIRKNPEGICAPGSDIVISSDRLECAGIPIVIDREYVWKSGAVGMRFSADGIQIDAASPGRGERPWVARSYRHREEP